MTSLDVREEYYTREPINPVESRFIFYGTRANSNGFCAIISVSQTKAFEITRTSEHKGRNASPLRMVYNFAVSTAFSISIITPRLGTKRQERIIKQQKIPFPGDRFEL